MRKDKQRTKRKPARKGRSKLRARKRQRAPRTAEQYFAQPQWLQDILTRVRHAITKMRADKSSLEQASHEFEIDPRTVVKRAGSALRKSASGRYVAKESDRLLSALVVLTHGGTREVVVKGSRQASLIGSHWAGVQKFLETGDKAAVRKFRGRFITDAAGNKIPLLTDLDELNRYAHAGVLSFETIYLQSV